MRYSLTFDKVPVNAALAAGIIASIAVSTIVCLSAVAFLIWRARIKYASQPAHATTVIMNPAVPALNAWGQTAVALPAPPPSIVVLPQPPSKV